MVNMLGIASEVAKSGLQISGAESAVVARNISRVDDPDASRKTLLRTTTLNGGTLSNGVSRAVDAALSERLIGDISSDASSKAQLDAVSRLAESIGDPDLESSPSARLATFAASLQAFASNPQSTTLGQAAVRAAENVVSSLNGATETIAAVRVAADNDIGQAVSELNGLLGSFEEINNAIVSGSNLGRDVTDLLDQRDKMVRQMSAIIEVRPLTRSGNDMVLFAAGGITLFERTAREVTFTKSIPSPGLPGGSLMIDGAAIDASGAPDVPGARIGGLLAVRDDVAVTYQRQLDELARGLIETFAESDRTATPTQPTIAGLFTWSGGPAIPASATVYDGLAGMISIAAAVDPDQGGDVRLLRDGGIGDPGNPAYLANTTGADAYPDLLQEVLQTFGTARAFDGSSDLSSGVSVSEFASSSAAWIEGQRRSASDKADEDSIRLWTVRDAWQNSVGVNLDDQMTKLIELERVYQASSRLISTIDQMFKSLLEVAR